MSTPTVLAEPKTPRHIEDFEEHKLVPHGALPKERQFTVNDPVHGSGVWSTTHEKLIVPLSKHSRHGTFYPIISVMSTGKIFWGSKTLEGHFYKLYVADKAGECAEAVDLPGDHSVIKVLSGKIILLKSTDRTQRQPYRLYSLESKSVQILDVGANGEPHSFFAPKNGKQVMLVFEPGDSLIFATVAGIFLIEEESFTVERLPQNANC